MIWQNPWAWTGLVALSVPLLLHLLSRRQARVQPFPTLRFLHATRLLPTRRTRLSDLLLLLVRLGILAAATAAMAQPLWMTGERQRADTERVARAVILDTSASMRRRGALDSAEREAVAITQSGTTSTLVRTSSPVNALRGAVAWLRAQSGRGEVVIVSDFQRGAVDSLALLEVPREFGVTLRAIGGVPGSVGGAGLPDVRVAAGDHTTIIRTSIDSARITASWATSNAPADSTTADVLMLAGADESDDVRRAMRAVTAAGGTLRTGIKQPVAVVFPGYPTRSALRSSAVSLDSLWMAALVSRLRRDVVLQDAAMTNESRGDSSVAAPFVAIARSREGDVLADAAGGNVNGRHGLLLFAHDATGSVATAALLDALSRSMAVLPEVAELDPGTVAGTVLRQWQREPAARTARTNAGIDAGASDARWMWLLVLALLALESWLRRARVSDAVAGARVDAAA